MSLPLTRRIAQAALLTAAGAASVVGTAGSAAAVDLEPATDLGGLSSLDTAGVADTAGHTAGTATAVVGQAGADTLDGGMPTNRVLSEAGQQAAPVAEEAVDHTVRTANDELGDTVFGAAQGVQPMVQGQMEHGQSGTLPLGNVSGDVPVLGTLPTGDLLG